MNEEAISLLERGIADAGENIASKENAILEMSRRLTSHQIALSKLKEYKASLEATLASLKGGAA